ncbi:methylmalonic aciduria and homocystinuria type D protein, mitochondrial-like [Planoprotostelium fungivorum]|uniref:Methylmalonic aciduria and homocystinuria type D protein, mitochondrial-like n=1 Tax=Planoprotostelium fungivorum TaxID=1890364 RepID=A0A2P6NVY0_9EUKA|nr:methylmalonic aciduria and homocystinuria type D protein, mitochondrial-like [Planoprotostelium fungivorum]
MQLDFHYLPKQEIQWSIAKSPDHLEKTFKQIFPNVKLDPLWIVPTWQKASVDMSGFGEEVTEERDKFTDKFCLWAEQVCRNIIQKGFWADFIDPGSGIPYIGERGSTVYMETDDAVSALGIEVADLGCCKAVCHHDWGFHAFLATLFSNAPKEVIMEVMVPFDAVIDQMQAIERSDEKK